jgi:hypothetical protein
VTVSTRGWLASVLPSLTVALLALWWPPMAMLLAAKAGIVRDTGFPRLFDPSTLGSLIELMLLTAGAWLLHGNARDGWVVLAWSRAAAFLRLTWGVFVLSRLNGIAATLHERVLWDSFAMLVVSAGLLAYVRSEFVGSHDRNHGGQAEAG